MTDTMAADPELELEPDKEAVPEPETEPVEEVEGEDPETPEVVDDQPEDDTEEVEYEGQTFHVPKVVKDAMMLHADYTRKTQDVADKGRTLETEREAFTQQVEAHRQNLGDFGQLAHTDQMLEQFRNLNWNDLQQNDPDNAQQLGFQFQLARDQREQIIERIRAREHETGLQAQRENAKQKEHLEATLAREIPNYTPELRSKMNETAMRHGISQEEVEAVLDPRYMKMLHLAQIGEEVLKRQSAAPKPKPVVPVPKVTGGKVPDTGVTDKQGIDAWMKRRNQQRGKQ